MGFTEEFSMRVTERNYRNALVLEMAGEFSYMTRKVFTAAMEKTKQSNTRHVILNFKQITFVDSAALGLLALAVQQFTLEHRTLSLSSPQGTVKDILELANFHKMMPVYTSDDAAATGKAA